ncbi:hypothetical protein [Streptomyces sp. Je 1-369]|uniref:hypothetical protein n=1 Tax=Streptomyces sp. Je 1-369 TaxID=2966192 RepID=UPI002285E8DF|nr:hypothetical protein [Streptomyces sp. Je 1-369]WAL97190.1 hypothetical protein NOO62_23465 [Streptomyces sp. Je 1-369]
MSSDPNPPTTPIARRRPVAASLAALIAATVLAPAVLLTSTAPAQATPSGPGPGPGPGPGEKIAKALAESPVYVDPSYAASAVPPARQKELVRRIEATGLPIKVVLVPLTKGDAYNGDADTLAGVVRDRLGDRSPKADGDLILLTTDGEFHDSIRGHEWPGEAHQAEDAANAVDLMDELDDAGLADLTAETVTVIERGNGRAEYEKQSKKLHEDLARNREPETSKDGDSNDSDDGRDGGLPWPLIAALAVPTLALALLAAFLVRSAHRRRTGQADAPFAFPRAVFAAARAADEAELRRRAEAEVLALGEAARAADTGATPGLQRALDAYDAAGTVLDSARGLPDLAGVLALVMEGRDALAGTPDPLPLCFFNPLHGRAVRTLSWRPLGHREQLRVSACTDCAHAVRDRRAPEVLTDTGTGTGTNTGTSAGSGPGGTPLPYFEVDASKSVWAATGYGSLIDGGGPDAEDGLARRVGRGDFSRGRGSSRG